MFKNCKKFSLMLFWAFFYFHQLKLTGLLKKVLRLKKQLQEKNKKSEWIKLKKKEIKANQKEFKENKKNISDETKKWITKKSKKDTYIQSIEEHVQKKIEYI